MFGQSLFVVHDRVVVFYHRFSKFRHPLVMLGHPDFRLSLGVQDEIHCPFYVHGLILTSLLR
jgi:hypothetical protein